MEFLDSFVLPHSGPNLELLKYLLILAQIIFLIFSGVLLGSALLSFFYGRKATVNKKPEQIKLAVEFINLVLTGRMMGVGLGIIPLLSIILIYTQLFFNTNSNIPSLLLVSSVLYFVGYILLYIYRKVLHNRDILVYLNSIDEEGNRNKPLPTVDASLALPGIIFTFFALWSIIGIIALTTDSLQWSIDDNFFSILFSFQTIVKFLQYLTISIAITGIAFIVKTFYWDKNDNLTQEYTVYSQKRSAAVALIFTALQPLFFIIDITLTPQNTVSDIHFAIILVSIVIVFFLVHLIYVNLKEEDYRYSTFGFYLILAIFSLIIIKDQVSFGVSSKEQILQLATNYVKLEEELLAKSGRLIEKEINGEELYKVKCVACHQFDSRLVGPPHKEVLVKYADNQDGMVKYILNPTKVNPDYPPMPSQGLTPSEAKAIVDFMFNKYKDEIK